MKIVHGILVEGELSDLLGETIIVLQIFPRKMSSGAMRGFK